MFRPSVLLAHLTCRYPALVALGALLIAGLSLWSITTKSTFDTDILNLLPGENPAVEGLRIYNAEFTQNRELAFLLSWDEEPEDVASYRAAFTEALLKQPWVSRLLDAPPLETSQGRASIHDIATPLLLNLSPEEFSATLEGLSPEKIKTRIDRLVAQASAGSPKARFELENDPLGLMAHASRPVAETISISDAFSLISTDGTTVIVPVITNQADNSKEACEATMTQVKSFLGDLNLGPTPPQIGVTGRSAYVEEIANSMQRDIMLTSIVSLACVTFLFWVGFRQVLPLIGISLILALTALATMAGGKFLFHELNILAISFCSILFGLGDDFSLLLCQRFFQNQTSGMSKEPSIAESIRHSMPGILWVALTTGIGFLALLFSGSSGFAQLGVFVALGVLLCALFMPLFLFLFVRKSPARAAATGPAGTFAHRCLQTPGRILRPAIAFFVLAAIAAVLPWRNLGFDITPTSLEPRNIPAARTLALMMEKFPATFEPVMVVMKDPQPAELAALNRTLRVLESKGLVSSSSSPSALVLDPDTARQNKISLAQWDITPSLQAISDAADSHGLNPEVFKNTRSALNSLKQQSASFRTWSDYLPSTSPWWFLLDRMLAPESGAAMAYLKVPPSTTPENRAEITRQLNEAVPGSMVTGWSQALASLVPWAQRELVTFGSAVTVLILLILAFVYRDLRLWMVHSVSLLAAAAGTILTLKLLQTPINLLNVLAFPLMLAVGVDYGTHIILAARSEGDAFQNLAGVLKPIALSGLTTATGFGSLMLAQNPALSGLGAICSIGVLWCLIASLVIVAPGAALLTKQRNHQERTNV